MEVKAELKKPYTLKEKQAFIIRFERNLNYKIKETETALLALAYTEKEKAQKREEQFNKDFFNTSLGYIRRQVTMADGTKKDFLSDLLPTISMAVQSQIPVTVLAYTKPDFIEPVTDWKQYQHEETVTPQFIQECFIQLQNDFKGNK